MNISQQFNSKTTYLLVGTILVLVIGGIVVFGFSEEFSTKPNGNGDSSQQANLSSVSISEKAEVIQMGDRSQVFQRIILDPFVLSNGDSQQIVIEPGPELNSVIAEVEDDTGTYEKRFKSATLNGSKIYYFKWQPKETSPGRKYPVTLTSRTDSGIKSTFTLSWQTSRSYE